ncbi:hypothetical protein [Mycobacterium sp. UM_WGJ]|uniref:DUF7159 family protein n=1 Tax=Mycobacterium sp. UM_WGJ TaxID=1370120 RepID=UPI0004233550|nr:hypothetical protein [Mycobacterium sp. UM_WGJ]
MEIVLGVSVAPSAVRMVLVEGEHADGVTVEHDDFDVVDGAQTAPERVVSAILGTREGAREGGYELSSTGVTWSNPAEANALREALAGRKVENVMLVSAFLAAAALAQSVGSATRYARTALLFVEPEAATLAVVNSDDGSITEIHRQPLSNDDESAVGEITELAAGAQRLESNPDGLFVVGSGVNVAMIKPELDKATQLPVSVPEEPHMALARGAALASAHAPLFSSSTRAQAWAQDPGTGELDPALAGVGYAYIAPGGNAYDEVDYNATSDNEPLAYSALPDSGVVLGGALPGLADDPELVDSRMLDFGTGIQPRERKPMLVTGGVAALFVIGVLGLAVALAVGMRAANQDRPDVRANVVTPKAPPPAAVVTPAPAPPAAPPAPAGEPAPPRAPAPAPQAPAPRAPAPLPVAPPPPPPALPPPPLPNLGIPGLPGGPPLFGPPRGGWGPGGGGPGPGHGRGGGPGGGHGRGGGGFPFKIPGLHF